jgi:hypothetical protein
MAPGEYRTGAFFYDPMAASRRNRAKEKARGIDPTRPDL